MAIWKKILFSLTLVAFIGLGSSCNRSGCPAQESGTANKDAYLQKSLGKTKKKKSSSSLFPNDFGSSSKKKKKRRN
ncbi:MAG: hypothetical protein ACPGXL_09020 [Chitinophagales bacterium]